MGTPRSPEAQRASFIVVAAVGILYGHHRWIEVPWRLLREDLETRVVLLEEEDRQARGRIHSDPGALEAHVLRFEREVRRLESRLPGAQDMPRLLDALQRQAQTHGLKILAFEPVHGMDADGVGPYRGDGYRLTVDGAYHDVGRFLAGVASLPQILRPAVLSMETGATGQARVALEIETLRRPEDDGPGWRGSAPVEPVPATGADEAVRYPLIGTRDPVMPAVEPLGGSTLDRWLLRSVLVSSSPERSLAVFEWLGDGVESSSGPPRRRMLRVRPGEALGPTQVLRVLPEGVEVLLEPAADIADRVVLIPLARRSIPNLRQSVSEPTPEIQR